MARYQFFANFLNFVADRADQSDALVAAQMEELRTIAQTVAAEDGYFIVAGDLERASRALAGFAAFLQEHILPEALAHRNAPGEGQIRWVIDTAMAASTRILAHAESENLSQDFRFDLPAPPP